MILDVVCNTEIDEKTAHGEAFFLYLESHRIRNAFQFDPLYAVNVSQIDPLPHQIALTPSEWLMAQRPKDDYWLYVVANAPQIQSFMLSRTPLRISSHRKR